MASQLEPQLGNTVRYSDNFSYPLTCEEIWLWQIHTSYSLKKIRSIINRQHFDSKDGLYFLPGRKKIVDLRKAHEQASVYKWHYAFTYAAKLSRLPTIEALFVTGALAMNNSPRNDDIDFMVVTTPHTLWITRLLVFLLLGKNRRPTQLQEHASARVSNKACDNLYIDAHQLKIASQNIFTAHEVLQAKCVFTKSNIPYRFIQENSWVKKFLPIAYAQKISQVKNLKHLPNYTKHRRISRIIISSVNRLVFLLQYLYMKPKITNEKVTLHAVFFHPRTHDTLII